MKQVFCSWRIRVHPEDGPELHVLWPDGQVREIWSPIWSEAGACWCDVLGCIETEDML